VEPILSKQEIDDLLSVIKQESRNTTAKGHATSTQQQIDYTSLDLFQISNKRDDQIRIPNFDVILDAFSHNYTVSLSNQLQRTFAIKRTGLESMPFKEYLLSKNNPGSIGVLNLAPLKYGALLVYDPELSFALIEIMLGASTELDLLKLDRNLTKIELTVLKATLDNACTDLDTAFRPITKLESSLLKIENNPRLVSITDPDAEVIVGTFEATCGDMSGSMEMVFPLATLDPFRDEFRDLLSVTTLKHGGWTDIIIEELKEMTATIIAQSGLIEMSVGQLLDFKKGDIITLNYDLNSPLKVLVEEKLKFFAVPGVHKGKKAISLTGIYE